MPIVFLLLSCTLVQGRFLLFLSRNSNERAGAPSLVITYFLLGIKWLDIILEVRNVSNSAHRNQLEIAHRSVDRFRIADIFVSMLLITDWNSTAVVDGKSVVLIVLMAWILKVWNFVLEISSNENTTHWSRSIDRQKRLYMIPISTVAQRAHARESLKTSLFLLYSSSKFMKMKTREYVKQIYRPMSHSLITYPIGVFGHMRSNWFGVGKRAPDRS